MAVTTDTESAPADTILALAVLLGSGANPESAWRHLAEYGDSGAQRISALLDDGVPVVEAIASAGGSWADVASAWEVAQTVGAPLADTLRAVAASVRDADEVRDDVRIALAEPLASARLMSWLPVLGIVVNQGLGFDPLGILFGTVAGWTCLAVGAGLICAARIWVRRLTRAAQPAPGTPGLHSELTATALMGGISVPRAKDVVAASDEWRSPIPHEETETQRVLELSRAAGAPAVELLRASAAHSRQRARADGRARAARLGTRLMIPMGVCTLPAFLALGVVPMFLSVLQATPIPEFTG